MFTLRPYQQNAFNALRNGIRQGKKPSAARMAPVVNLAQNVRVYLRGGNVGVAEHHLQAAQVGAALEQVRGETVAQHVRREPLAYPGGESLQLQQLP